MAFASMGIGPAGNVARGENVGIAGLQPRIDQNSAIQSQPSCLGELKARLDADAHDHKVRVDALAPLQGDLFVFNPSDLRAEVKAHLLSGVSFQDQIGELSPKHFFEWMLLGCDDVDGKHTADQGRGRLHRDETSAHDSNAGVGDRLGENASTVLKGPQHHHMRQVSSRNIQSSWSSARGEEKLFIGSLVPVRQTEAFVSEADLLDALITLEVDAKVGQGALVQIAGAGKRPVLCCRDFKLGARHSTLQAQVDLGRPDVPVRIVPCGCDASIRSQPS